MYILMKQKLYMIWYEYLLGATSGLDTFKVNGDSVNGGGGIFSLFSSSQLGRFLFGLFEGPCSNLTRFPSPRALCNLLTKPDLNPWLNNPAFSPLSKINRFSEAAPTSRNLARTFSATLGDFSWQCFFFDFFGFDSFRASVLHFFSINFKFLFFVFDKRWVFHFIVRIFTSNLFSRQFDGKYFILLKFANKLLFLIWFHEIFFNGNKKKNSGAPVPDFKGELQRNTWFTCSVSYFLNTDANSLEFISLAERYSSKLSLSDIFSFDTAEPENNIQVNWQYRQRSKNFFLFLNWI